MTAPTCSKPKTRLVRTTLLASLTLASCAHSTPAVTASASKVLSTDVQRLQLAARSGNLAQTARAGDQLRADLATQRAAGQISRARATAVLDQLARILADIAATPLVTATPSVSPSENGGHGKGKGNGDGGDNSDGG